MLKTLVLYLAKYLGIFALSRFLTRRSLRILCYHGTWQGPAPHYGNCLFMQRTRFARRMRMLKRTGYRAITLPEGCERLAAGTLTSRDLVITIDDGWKGTFRDMLPILRECDFPATLYVPTEPVIRREPLIHLLAAYLVDRSAVRPEDYPHLFPELDFSSARPDRLAETLSRHILSHAEPAGRVAAVDDVGARLGLDTQALADSGAFLLMTPEEIRVTCEQGVDVQLHTHTHKMHGFAPGLLEEEIRLNRQHIAEITGRPESALVHFCYPSGLIHPSLFPTLHEAGIVSATTTEFGLNAPGSNPLALKRILDCEFMTDLDLEARLSGFWGLAQLIRLRLQGRASSRGTEGAHQSQML